MKYKKIKYIAEELITNHHNIFFIGTAIIFGIYGIAIITILEIIFDTTGLKYNNNQISITGANLALWSVCWLVAIQSAKNPNSIFYKKEKVIKRHLFFIITSVIMASFAFGNFYLLFFGGLLIIPLFFFLF